MLFRSFSKYLKENDIEITGDLKVSFEVVADSSHRIFASHISPPMSELVAWVNKESDNFYTEMLLKTLSAHNGEQPATFKDGILQVRNFLADFGIDTTFVIMNDGSGMAGGNFTQTSIISEVLHKMLNHRESQTFLQSMTIAGIDGSLSYRMKNTPLFNNFRGKTGYVSGVRTLSGYLESSRGNTIILSIATNHFKGKVRPVDITHEQILYYLYDKY